MHLDLLHLLCSFLHLLILYHKNERVEAEYKKGSDNWFRGYIKDYTKDFNHYIVYFDDGRLNGMVPPESVRIPAYDKLEYTATKE